MYQKRDFVCYLTLLILVTSSVSANQKTGFLYTPKSILYEDEGRDVTMNWHFHIESRRQQSGIKDFLFGEWANPGYVKYKILYMNSQHRVQPRPEYVSKVAFGVNIAGCANCSANITIRNLTESDFKWYGIDILVGLHRSPLINFFELRAPPKIMFFRNLVVKHGDRTTIGCKAKGFPAPFVIIQKNNQTLCNGTRHCQYIIENVDTEDQGEYECIAKQGEKSDNSSMRLMVRKAPPKIMFFRNLVVKHGDRTTIGCKAKGFPAPFVIIQKNNQTLCNGTRHCQYIIENVDTEDQGEYECIAKQGEKSDNSSMRLMVRKDDMQPTTSTTSPTALAIALVVVAMVAILVMFGICYWKRKHKQYKFEKVEEGVHKV